ncbi:TRAP transporter substrate-binding protein [Gilvimarinus sp. F26214L]|uniref:TRAP transporter substrate-binding protein n=1 Tax=Gilvimarinus sp. DZF01 TaxID=3461371 RepID=UPI004046726E
MANNIRILPAVTLFLLAALVVLFGLYVGEKAKPENRGSGFAAGEQQQFRWSMVTSWPKNLPGTGVGAENFARFVNEASGGRLVIRVYGADELVPAMGVFDAVSSGSVEMGHSAAYYWKGKIPAAQFFTAVPFGMNAQEMNGWLFHGGGLELWREIYEPFNLIPFPGGSTGVQMAGWFNKEINSLADLRGLRMRIPGLGGEVFRRAGGTAVNVAGGEVYTAMQTGVIDAVDWIGPYNDVAFGLHKVARYYYYPGWQEPGPALEITVNKAAYESLPEDLQKIIALAARSVNQDMLDEYTTRNTRALQQLRNTGKVEIRRLPDDVLNRFREVSLAIDSETAANDPTFARVSEAYWSYLEEVRPYHAITEEAYYQLRSSD